jgi:hypothetical protein
MKGIHPAAIALGLITLAGVAGLWWFASALQEMQRGLQWSGATPPPDVMQAWAFFNFSLVVVMPALATAAAASGLGIVLLSLVRARQRSTRTMSAAGSTEKRTAVTSPSASPSISNSWASPPSIVSSTERPRE